MLSSRNVVPRLTVLLAYTGLAFAQINTRRRRHSLAGRVIAGIVVAIVCGLLLLLLCCALCVRRRRRGLGVLPGPNGGYGRFNVPFGGANQRPSGPGYNTGYNAPQGAYPQSQGTVLPPAYPNKEQYGGQAGGPGGFAPPPGPPPAAHVNDNSRFR